MQLAHEAVPVLDSLTVKHCENTFNGQNDKVVIQSPHSVWHRLHFLPNPAYQILGLRISGWEGQASSNLTERRSHHLMEIADGVSSIQAIVHRALGLFIQLSLDFGKLCRVGLREFSFLPLRLCNEHLVLLRQPPVACRQVLLLLL
jgi:hypothetical protein